MILTSLPFGCRRICHHPNEFYSFHQIDVTPVKNRITQTCPASLAILG